MAREFNRWRPPRKLCTLTLFDRQYPAEITPLSIRAAANGISTASNWTFNFLIVLISQYTDPALRCNGSSLLTLPLLVPHSSHRLPKHQK